MSFEKGYEFGKKVKIEEGWRYIETAQTFGDFNDFDNGLQKALLECRKLQGRNIIEVDE